MLKKGSGMTEEQKAIELIGCEGRSNCIKCGGRLSVEKGCSEFQNIMAMAQWKDEQIKDKIEQFFSEHDDYDYQVSFMYDYTDMDRLKIDLINFMGL